MCGVSVGPNLMPMVERWLQTQKVWGWLWGVEGRGQRDPRQCGVTASWAYERVARVAAAAWGNGCWAGKQAQRRANSHLAHASCQ